MKIGIIAAMEIELKTIVARLEQRLEMRVGDFCIYQGVLEGKEVFCVRCEPGKVNAAICAQTLLLQYKLSCVISTGIAGGRAPMQVGDVAIATGFVQHDMDTTGLGDPIGYISGIGKVVVPVEPSIVQQFAASAQACGVMWSQGIFATGDQFIQDAQKTQEIFSRFAGVVFEMESAAIAHACYRMGVPCGSMRVISDNGDASAGESYATFAKKAAERSCEILCHFVKHYH